MKNKSIIIFIVIILVIIGSFFVFNTFLKKNVIEQEDVQKEISPSIVVPEQAGGTNVFIENVTLLDGGYVVIHRQEDGKPGAIIGTSKFLPKGVTENFLMDIDEEIKEGDLLIAMIHIDDGDKVFSFPGADIPFVDSNGNMVFTKFLIVGEGALENEIKL